MRRAPRSSSSRTATQQAPRVRSKERRPVGALAITEQVRSALRECDRIAAMANDPRGYARWLYAELHAMDDAHVETIVIEDVPHDAAWDGVRDRLTRASR